MWLKPFRIERPGCRVAVALEIYEEPEGLVCSVRKLKGRMDLKPREWVRVFREETKKVEAIAKAAGCIEMRCGGRNWSRVLPDYVPLAGVKNGLRKALNDG
ncbi:MAG: hypothetical protein EOO12_00210 [Chitinophagaceae bacterium]|nr:MAG: hypothetical protein EOO12_00210 [Chitinophagaceae bacterium]